MPDDPVIHSAALVYSSDTTVLDSIITTHGLSWGFDRIFAASMNHSVWFHRQVRFDEWVLYLDDVAGGGRVAGVGDRTLLRPGRADPRDGRSGGDRQVLPRVVGVTLNRS